MSERERDVEREGKVSIGYQGNRLPLGLLLIWVALFAWGAWYVLKHMVPSLREWLAGR